jgi:hypothetical protein
MIRIALHKCLACLSLLLLMLIPLSYAKILREWRFPKSCGADDAFLIWRLAAAPPSCTTGPAIARRYNLLADRRIFIGIARGDLMIAFVTPLFVGHSIPTLRHFAMGGFRFERYNRGHLISYCGRSPTDEERKGTMTRRLLGDSMVYNTAAPLWFLSVVTGLAPSAAFVGGPCRRWRRRRRGLCVGCGYSLTGNVSGVCPECGKDRTRFKGISSEP